MNWRKRQDNIETDVYDAIDELSDLLGVEVPYYPTVFWVGRTLKFSDLNLRLSKKASFESRKSAHESYFMHPQIVVINTGYDNNAIKEEAAHFVHFAISGVSFSNRSLEEVVCLRVIAEMLGFLGARLIGSSDKNSFEAMPDLSRLNEDDWQDIIDACPDDIPSFTDFCEIYAHQQGYGLGERIYYQYLEGKVSLSFIKRLFLSPLSEGDSAKKKFIRLKNRFWPQPARQVE